MVSFAQDIDNLTIYIPGAKGGGFDRTGMAVRDALLNEGLVGEVEVVRSPGAGGLIGLAQFIESREGDGSAIFLGGRTNIGATNFNRSQVSLEDVNPIARLISTLRTDSGLIKWVGGSAGSVDELLILEMATAIGLDRSRIDFRAVPGGGDDVVKHLMSGQSHVAVSSFEELSEFYDRGDLRIIGVSSEERLDKLSAPTLKEFGLDIIFSDWKGVFAAPKLSESDRIRLNHVFGKLSESEYWAEAIEQKKWQNVYLSGDEFQTFINGEINRIGGLKRDEQAGKVPTDRIVKIVGRQYRWLGWAVGIIGLLLAALFGQRWINRRRQDDLKTSLDMVEGELERKLAGATDHINTEFAGWKLTESENEIGWLLLKGLSFKEIAEARGTSERTVRQQARAIYAKSGLSSRSDVAAYFFEDFVFGSTETS